MGKESATSCVNCFRLQVQVDALTIAMAELQALVAQLQAQLAASRKNSATSSKPPSSDIVKAPKPAPPEGQDKRKAGGQPGHAKHERVLVAPELLTAPPRNYFPEICPSCGHGLVPAGDDLRVVQTVEIRVVPLEIEEHRSHPGWCRDCRKVHYASFPAEVAQGGLIGPRLTTLIAYLKGACHASFSTIRTFLRDVVQVTISRGQLNKIVNKVSAALTQPYCELLVDLSSQPQLNVDETGHKLGKERWWTWCFRASLYTFFKIDAQRSSEVLIKVLGEEFRGVLGCDYFGAYRRYLREFGVRLQFCLAHLIRDVKFLLTLPGKAVQAYGTRFREALRELFTVIHRRESLSASAFQKQLEAARLAVMHSGTHNVPQSSHCQNLARRLENHGESYFRFITMPGVEPTNNLAEQAIRFVVIDRLVTQGTRSEAGNRWCERIWTVMATCAQQGRSVFEYVYEAVAAHWNGKMPPSLLPQEG